MPFGMVATIDGIMTPKDAHVLVPRTCEYVTLLVTRDFAGKIKVQDLEIDYLGSSGWVQCNLMGPEKWKKEAEESEEMR